MRNTERSATNEADARAVRIDPALKATGWGVVGGSRVLSEHSRPSKGGFWLRKAVAGQKLPLATVSYVAA
jgi:type I site-specific restriction endonuclease